MAKERKNAASQKKDDDGEEKRTRVMADYVFELHQDDGSTKPLGLVMHYPSEMEKVKAFLEANQESFGMEGIIRVCKKIYS